MKSWKGWTSWKVFSDKDIDAVATYVSGGFKGTAPTAFATCASCHGDDGKGMEAVAPNIRAYDDALVMAVLKDGKKGAIGSMPSFSGRLNETQEKALATFFLPHGSSLLPYATELI